MHVFVASEDFEKCESSNAMALAFNFYPFPQSCSMGFDV